MQDQDYLIINGERIPQQPLQTGQVATEPGVTKIGIGRRILKIALFSPRLTLIALAIPFALLSVFWKPLDRYFPKLNEFLHSDVTDNDDVKYQSYKLAQAQQAYNKSVAVCDDKNASLKQCRDAMIAAEPALLDIRKRADKLFGAFRTEETYSMPPQCKAAGEERFRGWDQYVATEQQVVETFRRLDVDHPENLAGEVGEIDALSKQEDLAIAVVNKPWPKECDNY